MKRCSLAFITMTSLSSALYAQKDPKTTEVWTPEPKVITPGTNITDAPSDALVLFDGKSASSWQHANGDAVKWVVANNTMTVQKDAGNIQTKQKFGDCQLHIEWRTPAEVVGEGQGRGNSGIFLMGRYEVQILDSYNNKTYANGQAGSIYKQHIPLVNACRKPGEWQSYDIIFTAPRFSDSGSVLEPARVTVMKNVVLVQNNETIWA